jgi:hypothetical protein
MKIYKNFLVHSGYSGTNCSRKIFCTRTGTGTSLPSKAIPLPNLLNQYGIILQHLKKWGLYHEKKITASQITAYLFIARKIV